MSKQYLAVWFFVVVFFEEGSGGGGGGEAYAEAKFFSAKKKLHKALRSVQFLASFISFYLKYYPIFHVVKR